MECSTPPDSDKPIVKGSVAEPPGCLRFSLRTVAIGTMASGVLLAVLVPSLRQARRALQRMSCQGNLKSVALALHCYHDIYKKFPCAITYADDGTAMHSWRVLVMPYLSSDATDGGYDYKEPWNGPNNCRLFGGTALTQWNEKCIRQPAASCPSVYSCPGAPSSQNRMCTNYVMLIDDRPGKPNGPPNRPGSVAPSLDPKSAVIIIEIADSDIHWMEPRDVLLSELSMKINDRAKRSLSSHHGGACVVHAGGTVEILDEATTEERLRDLLAQ
jgi:hypothetical protein